MTLLERVAVWWGSAPAPARAAPTPMLQPKPRVSPEYLPLYTYLEHRYASTVVLTFDQMESLLGFALPATAHENREWWTDAPQRTARHSDAWTAARRTATPNLPAGVVAFERLS